VREALGEVRNPGRIERLVSIVGMIGNFDPPIFFRRADRRSYASLGRPLRSSWLEWVSERTSGIFGPLAAALVAIATNGAATPAAPIPFRKERLLCGCGPPEFFSFDESDFILCVGLSSIEVSSRCYELDFHFRNIRRMPPQKYRKFCKLLSWPPFAIIGVLAVIANTVPVV